MSARRIDDIATAVLLGVTLFTVLTGAVAHAHRTVAIVGTSLGVALALLGGARSGRLATPGLGSVAAIGCALVSALAASSFESTEKLATWATLGATAATLPGLLNDAGRWRSALAVLLTVSGVTALHGLEETLWLRGHLETLARAAHPEHFDDPDFAAFASSRRARSAFGNPNVFASFLLLSLPIAMLVARTRGAPRWFGRALFGLVVGALLATGSLGAGLVVLALCGPFALAGGRPRVGRALIAAATVVAVAVGASLLWGPDDLLITARHRLSYWDTALDLIRAHPVFGVGAGHFGDASSSGDGTPWSQFAHSTPLELAATCGLAGWAFIIIGGIRMARGMKRSDPTAGTSEPGRPLGPCLAALAATLLMTWGMPAHRIAVAFVPAGSASAHGVLAFLTVTALSIAGIAWFFRSVADAVETGAARSALRWGVLAFALHGCVDFGFSHDGALAAAVLAGSLAWPGRPREASAAWRLVAAGGAIAFVLVAAGWAERSALADPTRLAAKASAPDVTRTPISAQRRRRILLRDETERWRPSSHALIAYIDEILIHGDESAWRAVPALLDGAGSGLSALERHRNRRELWREIERRRGAGDRFESIRRYVVRTLFSGR